MVTMTKSLLLAIFAICITLNKAQTLWVYDPIGWRATANAKLNVGSSSNPGSFIWTACRDECINAGISCLSFTWSGDILDSSSTGTCRLFNIRFGFPSGGFDISSDEGQAKVGTGGLALLQYSDNTDYFEKPMDLDDDLGIHLVVNGLRLNGKTSKNSYTTYLESTNLEFNYDQFLMYYRGAQPGYVNNSVSDNKYSAIVEKDDVENAEECAKYCTRNRGAIDVDLGTRCNSFNYNSDKKMCHLLTFSMEGINYNISDIPTSKPEDVSTGWFYYEGLVGDGCWVIQSQCRKWDDPSFVAEQNSREFTVGGTMGDIGIIRQYARDPVCSKCDNDYDFQYEHEYICLNYAREYHEDRCDNDADSATVAFWAQDGSGTAEIWNSWDLSEGCVIDLTSFDCNVNISNPRYADSSATNTRFAGKIFRDSIGEEEFAAAAVKKACWRRAADWYDYCELGGQGDGINTVYLNVSWPTDGSFYLEPAIDCKCDEYGLKLETSFGLGREYCTRDSTEKYCYREKQENYWSEWDILCDDLAEGENCVSTYSSDGSGTGCYLFYPEPESTSRVALTYHCEEGGRYGFDWEDTAETFIEVNNVRYKEIKCSEVPSSIDPCISGADAWTASDCGKLAETIHNSCGNDLEDADHQIMVWWRPEGQVMVFPEYKAPFETTWVRGFSPAAFYTNKDAEQVDFMPIRNARWQTFSPTEKSGNLRQAEVYYKNSIDAVLTMTIWSGSGITESVFLNQESIPVPVDNETGFIQKYVRFPLDNITITAGDVYTWQITSDTGNPNVLGDLGYVRGDGYPHGIGDLAWDYLFVTWIEGTLDTNQPLLEVPTVPTISRPWFEIWCVMIIILFIIFMVFLCLLHWKRHWDEKREKKEDKKFQAELRQRAMLQAEAERNAKQGILEESDDEYDDQVADGVSDYDEEEEDHHRNNRNIDDTPNDDDYVEEAPPPTKKSSEFLGVGGTGSDYKRVKSASKNEMPSDQESGGDGGYIDDEDRPKKKKKKRKKPKKKKNSLDAVDYDDDDNY